MTVDCPVEPLRERVNRGKARWLKRVMYNSLATSTEKCLAFAISDHLNCVTLDAWPGLPLIATRLGFKHVRTVQRAAYGLEENGLLVVAHFGGQWRFAPVFLPGDDVKEVAESGHSRPRRADIDVPESFLSILFKSVSRGPSEVRRGQEAPAASVRWPGRGAVEIKVADWLGPDGMELLGRLGALDDSHVDRLCRAFAAGMLTERELAAARLAAAQVRIR